MAQLFATEIYTTIWTLPEKARLLLENTELTIEVIADMLGYSNASNFYKAFHSNFHTSPRNYPSR